MGGKTPNPGSAEAVERGCKCPILDNRHGKGVPHGKDGFWISERCSMHHMADKALPGEAEVVDHLNMARDLIREAKGVEGIKGGYVTDHLDAAENWLDKVEGYLSLASLQAMQARAEKAERERDLALEQRNMTLTEMAGQTSRAEAAEARVKELEEALSPSAETKAAYMGEFSFKEEIFDGETDTYITVERTVPWTTIKEIMAAIRARTALKGDSNG